MRTKWLLIGVALIAAILAIGAVACDDDEDSTGGSDSTPSATEEDRQDDRSDEGSILDTVLDRGTLVCGVNNSIPGFGFVDPDGNFSGFDIDFCRAVAAAVFGDPAAVQLSPQSAESRLPAVQTGEVDVLIRNTTWTLTRDVPTGLTFATTTYYDGQGMMVRVADGITSIDELGADARICLLTSTTTELNLADRLPGSTAIGFDDNETLQTAFIEESCDGWTSDKSQLAGRRSEYPAEAGGPEALVILEETFSKEPLGPVTIDNDATWSHVVDFVVIGMIAADELGVTRANVAEMAANPPNVQVARLLGVEFGEGEDAATFDAELGINPQFMQDVISTVGNYNDVYEANVAPIGIPRAGTLNAAWNAEIRGLIYAPPWK